MNTLRALIVDDEPLARDELGFLLAQCDGVEVIGEAKDSSEAMALSDKHKPDIVFTDLRMPGPDGVALAEAMAARFPDCALVIVSAHDEGAVRAFDAAVRDYLLKPVRLERLQQTLSRIRELLSGTQGGGKTSEPLTRLAVRRRGGFVVVDVSEVVYFEVRDELVWAVTEQDRYALDLTLAALERKLPPGFFRSHRGSLVRIDRILTIEPTGPGTFELLLRHPTQPRVPLARDRARTLKELIPVAG